MDGQTLSDALAQNRAERHHFESLRYARLTEAVNGHPRGSVVLPGGEVIPGYPSIGRIHSLAAGLRQQFQEPFWAEEKIDGYNVRVVFHDGRAYAFSRGGFVCAFSTDRLQDLLPHGIFEREPDLVLCAEIAGRTIPTSRARHPS